MRLSPGMFKLAAAAAAAFVAPVWIYFRFVFEAESYHTFLSGFLKTHSLLLVLGGGLAGLAADWFAARRGWRTARAAIAGLGAAAAIVALTIPVAQSWAAGHSLEDGGFMWAGLIPVHDSYYYWNGVNHLERGEGLDPIGTRRPLNIAYFLLRHTLSGGSLAADLLIQAAVLGLACFLAARQTGAIFGRLAGLFLFLSMYEFAYGWAPTTMTESFGLTLGALALAVTLAGWARRNPLVYAVGMMLLAVGQNARGGVLLALPLLALAAPLRFGGAPRARLKALLLAVVAVAAGFIPSWLLFHYYGYKAAGSLHGGGYAGAVFGIARGGTGYWSSIDYLNQHGFAGLPEKEKDRILLERARETMRARPDLFLQGLGVEYRKYLRYQSAPVGSASVFTGWAGPSGPVTEALSSVFLFLAAVYCWKTKSWQLGGFLALYWLALAGSVPALAENQRRAFAVTVPYSGLLGAVGCGALAAFARRRFSLPRFEEIVPETSPIGPSALAVTLVVVTTAAPFLLLPKSFAQASSRLACPAGLSPRIVRASPGAAFVLLHRDGDRRRSWAPDVRESDYRRNFHLHFLQGMPSYMRELRPGQFLSAEPSLIPHFGSDAWRYYVGDQSLLTPGAPWAYWCVEDKGDHFVVRSRAGTLSPAQP
ncbi:MAG: hypothetical protein HY822_11725 [Acidobacteria bacterium]|nr:hypothetical protein [Acidobacteriota bacterium]